MFCLFIITLGFILISLSTQNERNSKRLLLNDPDVILARLTNMEHKLDQLQTGFTEEKTKNVNLRQTMTQIQTELKEEKTKNVNLRQTMTQIQTELKEEKTKNVNLRQTIQNMKSK